MSPKKITIIIKPLVLGSPISNWGKKILPLIKYYSIANLVKMVYQLSIHNHKSPNNPIAKFSSKFSKMSKTLHKNIIDNYTSNNSKKNNTNNNKQSITKNSKNLTNSHQPKGHHPKNLPILKPPPHPIENSP
jgi:hypothetical protein